MAHHKSAKKRIRQSEIQRQANKAQSSRVKSSIKNLRSAIIEKDKETASKLLIETQSLMAKLAKGSALKKETASRYTSRLAKKVATL